MNKVKTIIVDDEKKSRDGLEEIILDIKDLDIVKVCKDGLEAIEAINKYNPDLLLLDIQMPGISGFDVIKSISNKPFVIFITAYDQYALKAFEHHALDYLLKPFTNIRFQKSIDNALKIIKSNQLNSSLEKLEHFIRNIDHQPVENEAITTTNNLEKLIIRSEGKIKLIDFTKIVWIEGYDYYIKIHEDTTHIIKDSLKNMNATLPDYFIRVHKSAIINLQHLKSLESIGHSEMMAILTKGIQVKISRKYKKELLDRLSSLPK